MIIVDEAKTVPDGVFEAFDRCTRLFQLWVSSPGKPWGQFYEAFHAMRKFFWTRKVRSDECPHIDPAKRQRDLEKYGADHPLYRSMHDAEFTEDAERRLEKFRKKLHGPLKWSREKWDSVCKEIADLAAQVPEPGATLPNSPVADY